MKKTIAAPIMAVHSDRYYRNISLLFFLYSILLILPGIFYGHNDILYNIIFYGRFILFAVVAGIFFIGTGFRFARWDRVILLCWVAIGMLYVVRSLSIGSVRGILFGMNILFHLLVFLSLLKTRLSIIAARAGLFWGVTVLVAVSLAITLFVPFENLAIRRSYSLKGFDNLKSKMTRT